MAKLRKNYEKAVELYNSGESLTNIAKMHGVNRKSMWSSLKRRGVVFRPQILNGEENHFFINGHGYDPKRLYVRSKVKNAIALGKLKRKPCAKCGFSGFAEDGRCLVQAHHDDYEKILEVRWLCEKCHYEEHYHARDAIWRELKGNRIVDENADCIKENNQSTSIFDVQA